MSPVKVNFCHLAKFLYASAYIHIGGCVLNFCHLAKYMGVFFRVNCCPDKTKILLKRT